MRIRRPGVSGEVRTGGRADVCGWEWGSTQHGVCLVADDGAVLKRWMVAHTDHELAAVFAELATFGDAASTPVAIERGAGLVVGLTPAPVTPC